VTKGLPNQTYPAVRGRLPRAEAPNGQSYLLSPSELARKGIWRIYSCVPGALAIA
jgi:hypothetical protein